MFSYLTTKVFSTLCDFHYDIQSNVSSVNMQRCKKLEILEIYLCYFFLAGANFWAILGHFWAILAILGHFWAILSHFGSFLGHFLVLIFFGQKFISAIFITFCISASTGNSQPSIEMISQSRPRMEPIVLYCRANKPLSDSLCDWALVRERRNRKAPPIFLRHRLARAKHGTWYTSWDQTYSFCFMQFLHTTTEDFI